MLRHHYTLRYVLVQCSFKSLYVQVVSGVGSVDQEKSGKSVREVDKGVVVGVNEVSKTEQLREQEMNVRVSLFCFSVFWFR